VAAPNTDSATLVNLVTTAYDRQVRLSLRSVPMFRSAATTKVVDQTHPGSSVVFSIHPEMAVATTALSDNNITDPTGVALADVSRVTVTLKEYGNFTVVSKALREFALDNNLDGNVANLITYNLANSIDYVVRQVLYTTNNNLHVFASTGALSVKTGAQLTTTGLGDTLVNTGVLTANAIRYVVAKLRAKNVPTVDGQNYVAFIHPSVAADFRAQTATNGASAIWAAPHSFVDSEGIYAGEIGTFEGVRFIETPRVPAPGDILRDRADANNVTQAGYTTFVMGADALAEAVSEEFGVVLDGLVVDPLKRRMAIGWYGIAGWALFREDSLWAIKTTTAF